MDNQRLKIELLCQGARIDESGWDYYKRSAGFPVKLDGTLVSVPSHGKYQRYAFVDQSPFEIRLEEGVWNLYREGRAIREVTVADVPPFYEKETSDGVKMKKVFQVCGWTCLLTGVVQSCSLQRKGTECRFCGTIYNPVYEGRLDRKTPRQLAEAAAEGKKDGMEHIVITSGIMPGEDRGAKILLEAAREIKETVDLPIQAELAPPEDLKHLERLLEYVDSVSINVETMDQEVRQRACPDKSRIPYEDYFSAWKLAGEVLGEDQVNSWIIAGLGEDDPAILEGAESLAGAGVFPFLVPLRSTKGTPYGEVRPPSPDRMEHLTRRTAEIAAEAGLKPERIKAGCLRCSACSAVRDYMRRI
jgi:radical SAM protein (TIGR04043 family)